MLYDASHTNAENGHILLSGVASSIKGNGTRLRPFSPALMFLYSQYVERVVDMVAWLLVTDFAQKFVLIFKIS